MIVVTQSMLSLIIYVLVIVYLVVIVIIIHTVLEQAGIKYEREKRFASCKNKRTLPFDFYVENKYLIEFDGIQHYSNESKFYTENVKHNDKIKDTWCKKHHIPLIRIPYTHFDNLKLEDLLLDTSQFVVA